MGTMNALFELIDQESQAPASHPDVVDGNAFGAHEAEQEQAAYTAEMSVEMASEVAVEIPADPTAFMMPSREYLKKGQRYQLVFQGVCTHCAHCGMVLTDAISLERCLGPTCAKKGYTEDPVQSDEIQAMIDLAEYPDLVNFLTERYKPLGVRGLMNGLVKICGLNRRSPVHAACTDAIESLGFGRLASTLRESIAVVEIKTCKEHPQNYTVWVKKSEWSWGWTNALRTLDGTQTSRQLKGTIVPKRHKRALWELMLKNYEGLCATVYDDNSGKKTIKIVRQKVTAQQDQQDVTPSEIATST